MVSPSSPMENSASAVQASPLPKIYKAGTLTYTKRGLVMLFVWMLWGDFVFQLMEMLQYLLPLVLEKHGASNKEIGLISMSLQWLTLALLVPMISFKSDRYRSRMGRRRPFIIFSTPFVVLFLCVLPYAPEISNYLLQIDWIKSWFASVPRITPVIVVFGVLFFGFQFFNAFISSVYYYLIPDVIPQELLGRFNALFRLLSTAAVILFNQFAYKYVHTHTKPIFIGIALFYGFFILLMCWGVKEGEYPPIPKESQGDSWWKNIRIYSKECFGSSPYFWWVFLTYAVYHWTMPANNFVVFYFTKDLGMSPEMWGKISNIFLACYCLLLYPLGVLQDRWGSHKMLFYSCLIGSILSVIAFFAIQGKNSAIAWRIIPSIFFGATYLSLGKWMVDSLPRDRYGQFASAAALFMGLGMAALGPVCGWMIDLVQNNYRYCWLWQAFFGFGTCFCAWKVYSSKKPVLNPSPEQSQAATISGDAVALKIPVDAKPNEEEPKSLK